MKIASEIEPQGIAINHLKDIDFEDFMKIYKKCTVKPYSFFVNDTTLPSDDTVRFKKNHLDVIK